MRSSERYSWIWNLSGMGQNATSGWIYRELEDRHKFPNSSNPSSVTIPEESFANILVLTLEDASWYVRCFSLLTYLSSDRSVYLTCLSLSVSVLFFSSIFACTCLYNSSPNSSFNSIVPSFLGFNCSHTWQLSLLPELFYRHSFTALSRFGA